jgi:hypothetical protein
MRTLLAVMLLAVAGAPAFAAAAPDARADFIHSCEKQMYMSAPACACLADKAGQQLDARAIAYLSLPPSTSPTRPPWPGR